MSSGCAAISSARAGQMGEARKARPSLNPEDGADDHLERDPSNTSSSMLCFSRRCTAAPPPCSRTTDDQMGSTTYAVDAVFALHRPRPWNPRMRSSHGCRDAHACSEI